MAKLNRFSRVILFLTLLISLQGFVSAPVFVGESASAAPMSRATSADLSLSMSVDKPAPNKNENIVFTITVTNNGPDTATGVKVNDVLPAGLTYVSDDGLGAYSSGVWTVGTLLNSANATLKITAKNTTSSTKTNSATALSVETDTVPGNNTASKIITPKKADLKVTLGMSPLVPALGSNVAFTITVKNNGPDVATGITVLDLLPVGLPYVSDDGGGTYNSVSGIWVVGSLANGASTSLKITANLPLAASGTYTNTAQINTSDQYDANPADNTALRIVTAEKADLEIITNAVDNTVPTTKYVKFTIQVKNYGPSHATGVTVKDVLPNGVVYISDNLGTYNSNSGIWAIGFLANGDTATLIIDARISTPGAKTNVAEVWTSDQYDNTSTPGNGVTSEDDYRAAPPTTPKVADLSLTKTVDTIIGSPATFTITVKNNGPDDATGVEVKDLLPLGLTFSPPATVSIGSYNDVSGIWTIGTIANGAISTLIITATTGSSPILTNLAEIWKSDQVDPDSTPGSDVSIKNEDDDDGAPFADLSLTKTVDNSTPALGDSVVFTITVNNAAGSLAATNVEVKDLLDATNFIYMSDNSSGAYTSGTGFWTVGTLASGANKSLSITAKVNKTGILTNSAEITKSDQFDSDSTIANGSITEDDYASAQITSTISSLTVVISEVAWMGTAASGSDEWVELYNKGAVPIDISGWKLLDNSTTITLTGSIPAGGYFLLEDNESAVSDIAADQISPSLSLTNSGEILQLLDASNTVIDTANKNGGTWSAGSDTTKGTMERVVTLPDSDTAWFTNAGIIKNGKDANGDDIWGTPKKASAPTPTPTSTTTSTPTRTPTKTITPTPTRTPTGTLSTPTITPVSMDLLINEVAWGGTVASGSDEWIELYNPSATASIDLTGWVLEASDGSPSINLNPVVLAPGQYYVIAASSTVFNDVTVDQTFSGSLSNDGEYLKLIDAGNTLADTANSDDGAWPAGRGSPTYASMERTGIFIEGPTTWATYDSEIVWAHDRDNNAIKGTPGRSNWVISVTLTPTATLTSTVTFTPTRTPTRTGTPSSATALSVLINEVAWGGTTASSGDEWIELYNTTTASIDLSGWKLVAVDGSPSINLDPIILAPGQFYILAANNAVFNDVGISQTFSGSLSNDGEYLKLVDGAGVVIDTANSDSGAWPAGSGSPTYASMERTGKIVDGPTKWATYASATVWAHDRSNNAIRGTPGISNWVITVTLTPTILKTSTRTPTPQPTSKPIGRPVINEFLARPGFDWNQDGQVNVYDEFIEIKNIGVVDVNMAGWILDDEASVGSSPFTLPDITLKPGERALFYGLQTNLLLGDGGDTVRLLNPSKKILDAYTYSVVKVEDQSVCRLPDGNGSWYKDCIPTPNRTNTREGVVPSMPDGESFESPVCQLPDTLPADFLFAECRGSGSNIWDSFYWDKFGWQGIRYIFGNMTKWESFVE